MDFIKILKKKFSDMGKKLPIDYRLGYMEGFEAGYKKSIIHIVEISPMVMKYLAEEQYKLKKEKTKDQYEKKE